IVANGVLNAPDYTRTCNCSYQNQSSLALVHDPDVEMWVTYFGERGDGPLQEVGINLGAPGNRRAEDGRFWIGHPLLPYVRNPEKESGIGVDVEVTFDDGEFYTHHSSRITNDRELGWVTASGCRGISRLELDLGTQERVRCRVRLHFAEPDRIEPGHRVFDVAIEGEARLRGVDVVAEAEGRNRSTSRTLEEVEVVDSRLTLEFSPARAGAAGSDAMPLLCGLEVTVTSRGD
ncbi:MAG: malectin domain-containing carbohydrate-binding protein, partial [Candidatus Latescibacteria bacterium]|nr:malectin domain-containing carbohydrate-binding protein [Candidatus Latescibacterota bacterium]